MNYPPIKVQLHQNPKNDKGFAIHFPYSQEAVQRIKLCLGTNWEKNYKAWLTEGPEVLLDMNRFGIEIEWISTDARKIAEGFREQLWAVMDARSKDIEDEEFAYQRQGTEILASMPNIILGDDMGLGKSKQSLDAAVRVGAVNVLILAPKTLTYNWKAEIEKWHPNIRCGVVPDSISSKRNGVFGRREFWQAPPPIVIANYEKLRMADWPFDIEWDVVIPDEASRLKNQKTATYKAVKRVIKRSKYAWALTGTPLEIRLEELYNILSLLRPTVLGNFMRFRDQHLECDWSGSVVGAKNMDLLRERIAPFMLRRTKSEVLRQLPAKIYNNIYVPLSTQEATAYEMMTSEFNNWLDEHGVTGGGDPMVQTLRMRQFCATPDLFTQDLGKGSKFDMLQDICDNWNGKIVVFCFFKEVINRLHSWLNCHPDAIISGDVTANDGERIRRAKAFSDGELGKVFVSTDAGGMGINIVGADLIIHYDQLWNPQKMHQREDRLHRIGQVNQVTVANLMCLDTIDVGMFQLNKEREHLFEEVVDGAEESILRKLSAPRLRRIVEGRLNREDAD